MTGYSRNRGFSLLEVLVAFTITAMAVAVISQIYAKGTTSAILGEEYAVASLIAESKLASLTVPETPEEAVLAGTEGDKYHWEITVADYIDDLPAEQPMILLKEITLDMHWDSRGKQRRLRLHTLRPVLAQ